MFKTYKIHMDNRSRVSEVNRHVPYLIYGFRGEHSPQADAPLFFQVACQDFTFCLHDIYWPRTQWFYRVPIDKPEAHVKGLASEQLSLFLLISCSGLFPAVSDEVEEANDFIRSSLDFSHRLLHFRPASVRGTDARVGSYILFPNKIFSLLACESFRI